MRKGLTDVASNLIGFVKDTVNKYASLPRDEAAFKNLSGSDSTDGKSFTFGTVTKADKCFVNGTTDRVIFKDIAEHRPVMYPMSPQIDFNPNIRGGIPFTEASDVFKNAIPLDQDITGIVPAVKSVHATIDGSLVADVISEGTVVPIPEIKTVEERPSVVENVIAPVCEDVPDGLIEIGGIQTTDAFSEKEVFSDAPIEKPLDSEVLSKMPSEDSESFDDACYDDDCGVIEIDNDGYADVLAPVAGPVEAPSVESAVAVSAVSEAPAVEATVKAEESVPDTHVDEQVEEVTVAPVPEQMDLIEIQDAVVVSDAPSEQSEETVSIDSEPLPETVDAGAVDEQAEEPNPVLISLPKSREEFQALFGSKDEEVVSEDESLVDHIAEYNRTFHPSSLIAKTTDVEVRKPTPGHLSDGVLDKPIFIDNYDRDILFMFMPELIDDEQDIIALSMDNNSAFPEDFLEGYDRRFAKWAGAAAAKKKLADIEAVKKQVVTNKSIASRKARPRRSRRIGKR